MNKNDLVQYSLGDISIKKVLNGWLLIEGDSYEEENINISVYESKIDTSTFDNKLDDLGDAEALSRLLTDAFEGFIRSKKYGGITVSFYEKGYEKEE